MVLLSLLVRLFPHIVLVKRVLLSLLTGYFVLYVKIRQKIRDNTELKNFPLYCPGCKQETLINVKIFKSISYQEPDA